MAAAAIFRQDDDSVFPTNCFPVKPLVKPGEEGDGAWLVAHKAEQRRHFKAVICTRPKSYNAIKFDRIQTDRIEQGKIPLSAHRPDGTCLDGFYLLRQSKVEDPTHICSVNISGHGLSEANSDDFVLFDSVLRMNAAENMLEIDSLSSFPNLQELELPLNGLCNIGLSPQHFQCLEFLDVSYNNLTIEDIQAIGLLQRVKQLHLSGNSLRKLPADMAEPMVTSDGDVFPRFNNLEVLMLDDNKLSDAAVFSSLAGLRRLKILNMEHNLFTTIPFLKSVSGKVVSINSASLLSSRRKKRSASARTSRARSSRATARENNANGVEKTESGSNSVRTSELDHKVDTIEARMLELNRPDSAPMVAVDHNEEECFQRLLLGEVQDPEIPPPFHTLRCINLAHNLISEEESLLPVAVWPMLSELIIHNNPLTTQRSGDPPILTNSSATATTSTSSESNRRSNQNRPSQSPRLQS